MERTIKLIWDFKGDDSEQIAKHHVIHLKEFATKESLVLNEAETISMNNSHCIAFILVKESEVFKVRDALIPHRAEVVE
jgi:hypothetical protein